MARTSSAVLAALLAVVGLLAACSKSDGEKVNDAPLPDAKTLIDASSKAARELHDVQLDLSVEGTVPNLPVKSVSAYLTNQPKVSGQGDAEVVQHRIARRRHHGPADQRHRQHQQAGRSQRGRGPERGPAQRIAAGDGVEQVALGIQHLQIGRAAIVEAKLGEPRAFALGLAPLAHPAWQPQFRRCGLIPPAAREPPAWQRAR